MNICKRFPLAGLLMTLAVSVSASPIVIPRDTVIPVTMDKAISSATSKVGKAFYAHHTGIDGGGFPEQTKFTGNIDSVTRASGRTAGQIGVSFVSAKLPDGTRVPIVGQLISLDKDNTTTDPTTGRLVGTTDARKANLKFTAIGAGAGLILGQVIGKKPLIGTVLGGLAGYLYGAKQAKAAVGRDVTVPAGTQFGILLTEDATFPNSWSAISNNSTEASTTGSGWQVAFNNQQPVMSGNDLMVPFRSVMNSIDMPFDYNSATKNVRISDYDSEVMHTVGTRIVDINGQDTRMDASSRIMNGSIYVPASYIELLTSRTAYWNQKSGILRIE